MSRYFKMNRKYFKLFLKWVFAEFLMLFSLSCVFCYHDVGGSGAGDVSLEYKSVRGINYKRENTISALHYCSPYMNSSPRESCCIQYATQTKQVLVCVVFSLRLVKRGDNRNRAFQQNMIQTSFLIQSRMEKIKI